MASVLEGGGRANGLVARQLDRLFSGGTAAGQPDLELLRRFAARGDEAAFAALVERHGPMVLGVCRRWLGSDAAAVDDAFQATFLVLVKKARAVRNGDRLAPWLYGVALRVARRSLSQARRRDAKRRLDVDLTHLADEDANDMFCSFEQTDTSHILDEELERLPEKLRVPLVLCYLQGLTHEQAAAQLRWPVGTVRSRMALAREKLRDRLGRRGVGAPTLFLARAFAAGRDVVMAPAVPPALIDQTVRLGISVATTRASSGVVPAAVSSLTDGVTHAMMLKKLTLAATIATAGALTTGAAVTGKAIIQQAGFGAAAAQDPNDEVAGLRRALASERAKTKILQDELSELQKQVEQLRTSLRQDLLAGGGGGGGDPLAETGTRKAESRPRNIGITGAGGGAGPAGIGAPGSGGSARAGGMNPMPGAYGRGAAGSSAGMGAMPGSMGGAVGGMGGRGAMMAGSGDWPMAGMGMGAAMGGMPGNSGMLMTKSITAVQPKGSNRVVAHNVETGEWKTYKLPEGVTAVPIMSENLLALQLEGEKIAELAVYTADSGGWSTIELEEPASGTVSPVLSSGNIAVYTLGDRVYAFSATAGIWDVLKLESPAQPIVMQSRAYVESDGSISIFSAKTGKWSTFDPKSEKPK